MDGIEILKQIRIGKSDKEIAKLAKCDAVKVTEIRLDAVRSGLLPTRFSKVPAPTELDKNLAKFAQIREWLEEDENRTYTQAARKFEVPEHHVARAVGPEGTLVKKMSNIDILKATAGLIRGRKQADIARDFGVSREWIRILSNQASEAGVFEAVREFFMANSQASDAK